MSAGNDLLLSLNCGSSSLKFRLFSLPSLETIGSGSGSAIGSEDATLKLAPVSSDAHPAFKGTKKSIQGETHDAVFGDLLKHLGQAVVGRIKVVTHRIVHGGTIDEPLVVYTGHTEALERLEALSAFAPLHNHHAVLVVKVVLEQLPEAKNVLCFDTLFHRTLTPDVYTYPVPDPPQKSTVPIRRYGFHGLSYASILKSVSKHLDKAPESVSMVVCHLGSGASMCAIRDGKSVETTMGLTPLEGLPGGTRSGSLDPSLVFHLYSDAQHAGQMADTGDVQIAEAERKLNQESGLQALGGTNDFGKLIEQAAKGGERQKLAIAVFENRVLHYLGSYLFLLENKPDCVVFSGGIGEKSAELRASIAQRMAFLGVELDTSRNEQAGKSEDTVVQISTASSAFGVYRVLTDEELECAHLAMSVKSQWDA